MKNKKKFLTIMISPTDSNYKKDSETLSVGTSLSIPKSMVSPSGSVRNKRGGIIFIWPQRKNFHKYREFIFSTWFLTHLYYWMHLLQLLPTDHVLNIPHPPWSYEPPPLKPRERDFIIEPDWDS